MILEIDMTGNVPIYQQIRNQIMYGIATGLLKPGEQLPTVRQLAGEIGVNPMTVNKAYDLLKKEGFILIDRRHGAQVCEPRVRENPLDEDFDQRAQLLIAEARIKGASAGELRQRMLGLIDRVYKREGNMS
jgi:GntR family transcriptional regulator